MEKRKNVDASGKRIELEASTFFKNNGTLFPELKHEAGDPTVLSMVEPVWGIVFEILIGAAWFGMMTGFIYTFDYSGDPYEVLFPAIAVFFAVFLGLLKIVEGIQKFSEPKRKNRILIREEGIITNDFAEEWEKIADIRLVKTRVHRGTAYEILILFTSGFLERQGIGSLKCDVPNEPEMFYYLRKAIDYHLSKRR